MKCGASTTLNTTTKGNPGAIWPNDAMCLMVSHKDHKTQVIAGLTVVTEFKLQSQLIFYISSTFTLVQSLIGVTAFISYFTLSITVSHWGGGSYIMAKIFTPPLAPKPFLLDILPSFVPQTKYWVPHFLHVPSLSLTWSWIIWKSSEELNPSIQCITIPSRIKK